MVNLYVYTCIIIYIYMHHYFPSTVQTSYGKCVQDLEHTQLVHPKNINHGPSCIDRTIQDGYN